MLFDKRYLTLIAENFSGGPVGIETIAAALGEARDAIEEIVEPYLMQQGFVQRTPARADADRRGLWSSRPQRPTAGSRAGGAGFRTNRNEPCEGPGPFRGQDAYPAAARLLRGY